MSDAERLASLRRLSGTGGFESHTHALAWAEEVLRLITFNNSLRQAAAQQFNTLGTEGMSRDMYGTAVRRMQGIVAQAIATLEGMMQDKEAAKAAAPVNEALLLPDEMTVGWLAQHVPLRFWLTLVGAAAAVFLAGIFVGQSKLYTYLMDKNVTSENKTANTPNVNK